MAFMVDAAGECMVDAAGECMVDAAGSCMVDAAGECMVDAAGECMVDAAGECMVDAASECMVDAAGECMVDAAGECMVDAAGECMVDAAGECMVDFQIGAGLYAVGRPIQKKEHHPTEEDGQIGTNHSLPLERGALFNRFFGKPAHGPPHVAGGLLALSVDVETNPGPTTQTWTCDMCSTEITRRQTSYRCNSSPSHWVHKHCTTLRRNTDYTPTWKCNIHNQQNNTITDQHHQLTDNNNNMQQNLNINQPHSINNNKTQQQINSKKTITIIQININGLTTKIHELKNLTDYTKIDIITIQETKLKPTHRTPYLKDYTAIRTDRTYKNRGGLMTYIKNDIIFTEFKTPHTTNHKLTELQHIKIHLANHKHLNIFNIYIPPRDTTNPDHSNSQEDITNCMTHILTSMHTIHSGTHPPQTIEAP